jgi:hypothetical protein
MEVMMLEEDDYLFSLRKKARNLGFVLLRPQNDMYGGYECSIQRIRDGAIHVVMNCPTPIQAAEQALALYAKDDSIIHEFESQMSDA